jgi:PAS domain S-box-containing protein
MSMSDTQTYPLQTDGSLLPGVFPLRHLPDPTFGLTGSKNAPPSEVAATVVELTADAVVSVDAAQRIVYMNPAAERLFGFRAGELLGESLQALTAPAAAGARNGNRISWSEATASHPLWPEQGEIVATRADGSLVIAEVRSTRVQVGTQALTTYLLRDCTEQRRADEERRLLQSLALLIGEAPDLQTALRLSLKMIGEVTGWTAGEAWLPDPSDRLLRRGPVWSGRDGLNEFHQASERITFGAGEGLPGRVWAAGKPAWIEDVVVDPGFVRAPVAHSCDLHTGIGIPVLAAEKVVAVITFYHTEVREHDSHLIDLVSAAAAQLGTLLQRRRTEESLQHHAEELARSNAELEQFAYVASHDLQEPLRMVASYTQLLAKRYGEHLDGDAHEFIGYAVEGVTRMQQLIHDLLAFSRVGTRGEAFQPTSLDTLLDRVLRDIEPAVEASGAQIAREPLPTVVVDSAQLYQVFQNLIVNAMKFHGSEPARVEISSYRAENGWVIAVKDKGIGIKAEYFARIFVLFQRLHSRAEYPGTGIGLAICKKIVERHGGRIWVESEPGRGTTFFFSLPDRPEIVAQS